MATSHRALQDLLPRTQRQRLLLRALRHPTPRPLRRLLPKVHPADIAQLFALLTPAEQSRLLELLFALRMAGPTLRELDPELQRSVVDGMVDETLAVILGRLSADDAAELLRWLADERRERLYGLLDRPLAQRLRNLLTFGESTAGGLMNPEVVAFAAAETVGATLAAVRRLAESRSLFYLYVIDERGHLVGIVSLWQLVTSPPEASLRSIMSPHVVSVQVDTQQEEVARVVSRYDLLMVPVVDGEGRLVGVVTVDDIIDVIEREATEDLYRLANLAPEESLATPARRSVRLRLPWLLVNLATAFLAAWVVSLFEATIARYVVLAVFMPIVAGMGGNAGTQSLTVVVRSLALGELDLRRTRRVVAKEIGVGLLTGLGTGLVLAAVAWAWEGDLVLAGILCFAETTNLVVAGLFGAAVPLVLRRLRLDPALGSSIFVTTATDVGGFLAFLGTATLLLHHLG